MTVSEMSVLICDDSVFARTKLKNYILTLGVKTVYEAIDGQEAVDKYIQFRPTVAFVDIVMPIKSGIDVATEIVEFDKNAKVVMASSVGTQNYLKEAINAGAYEFLQKPLSNEQVGKILEIIAKGVK
ncbi:MAG: response regulator [Oscillospiraceae bacterium]